MRGLAAIIVLILALPGAAVGQQIVTDLSQQQIELTHSFKGQNLFLYGAIKDAEALPPGSYDIVITISGEERVQIVMRKERILGFWVNTESRTFENVPEFYGQASTRPLREIADKSLFRELGLGLDELDFVRAMNAEGDEGIGYARGLIKAKEDFDLYQAGNDAMPVTAGILFRADFFFPPRVPSGRYHASVFLFQGGRLIGRTDRDIAVEQVGFERMVYLLAHEHPSLYGLLAIIIALAAGWLAGFITRGRGSFG